MYLGMARSLFRPWLNEARIKVEMYNAYIRSIRVYELPTQVRSRRKKSFHICT